MKFLMPAIAASITITLLATACDKNADQQNPTVVQESQLEEITADTVARQSYNTQSISGQDWDKKIIRDATITVEVEDYKRYNSILHNNVAKWQAYISGEEESNSDHKIENIITIKIPVQYFDEAIQELSASGKITTKQLHSQDVTAEYYDTKLRMEARKKIRLRYLELLRQSKNIEEVLQVEKEINAIQEQIEVAEGKANYLNHSAAYCTIHLTFFKILNPVANDPENPGFAKRIQLALYKGFQWIGELIIVIITFWPLWVALITTIWLIKRMTTVKLPQRNHN